ncbi:SDR family NAD(P)-dependent oxidoreductase [Nocardia sp. NPDC059091]|uniref:SDR family NAD(P)-dependent oxidoreductase n=1 Tax=unclassified Nocardia TaxID=2637762 RepID=UPI00367F078A
MKQSSVHGAETSRDIAIVGIACRVPGADDPRRFWDLLREGRDCAGALDDTDTFDAEFFDISPAEAGRMDPQQRLALELGWEVCESGRLSADRLRGTEVGVFLGVMADDYAGLTRNGTGTPNRFTKTGLGRSLIANRLSRFMDWHGPSLSIDTGQSSSLVAVHLACESLRRGESTVAVAGGVQLNLDSFGDAVMSEFGAVSPDGKVYAFDSRANGTVRGEGGGMVALELLEHALAEGHEIFAVIRGSAVNNDGTTESVAVPSADRQEAVIRQACRAAGVGLGDVQYVELHGTGTVVGDRVEATALASVYGTERTSRTPLLVGSVKTNLGHLEAAAGIASLIKVVLALRNRMIPASLNFSEADPEMPMDRLRVVGSSQPWQGQPAGRLAGISAFGMGGTNAHVILAEALAPAEEEVAQPISRAAVVPLVLSGKTAAALAAQAGRLEAFMTETRTSGADIAVSSAGRPVFDHRAVVFAAEEPDLAAGLSAVASGQPRSGVVTGQVIPGGTALVFSGQGAQRLGMGRELAATFPVFAAALDEVVGELDRWLDRPLREVMWGDDAALLDSTGYAQPALFAYESALYRLLVSWGVTVDAVAGHSVGEIAAAHAAGVLSLPDAARLVTARGRSMQALPPGGAMAAIQADPAEVEEFLSPELDLAAVNGPASVVVSGAVDAVESIVAVFGGRGRKTTRLRVSHAFHSASMEPMLAAFAAEIADLTVSRPRIPVVSALTGQAAGAGYAEVDYWVEHVRRPVRFGDAVTALAAAGVTRFLEVGPDAALAPMIAQGLAPEQARVATTAHRESAEPVGLVAGVAELFAAGGTVNWSAIVRESGGRWVSLPPYAFQRRRYWFDAVPEPAVQARPELRARFDGQRADQRYAALLDLVRQHTSALLEYPSAEAVAPARTFKALGFDSLGAVRFRNALADATGLRLPSSLIFDHPTPDALARFLVSELETEPEHPTSPTRTVRPRADEPLAIVGMSCRFPGGVDDAASLWALVDQGIDGIGEFPADRGWDTGRWYDPQPGVTGKSYTRSGGFLGAAGDFDADFFGISPKEALAMDPQQRLLLEVSWEALEDAGIDPHALRGSDSGVYVGLMSYGGSRAGDITVGGLPSAAASVASGRVSYALGLEGPAVTVDTACSSSLVALHLAGQAVRSGECELALVGGVTVMATPHMFVEFSRQQGLSPDGRCRSFASGADGTGWAEGVGVMVVERLSRAKELGHHVLAVVAGSAVNQDGASNGLTAPNGPSQQRVIHQALANAGLGIGDVDVVEAHGTGTKLGDPIEAQALLATYGQRDGGDPLWLGSIKSNIGHSQAAAGVAGVIKMVQAMRFERMPATLHVDVPSPHVDWSAGRVELLTEAREWPRNGRPRRAAVSSFGISGTNAHVILEEAPAEIETSEQPPSPSADVLLPWILSAKSGVALAAQANRLMNYPALEDIPAADVAVSLAGRALFEHRAVVLGTEHEARLMGLKALGSGGSESAESVVSGLVRLSAARTALVFPGQGSQWVGMGRELLESSTVFADHLRAVDEVMSTLVDWSVLQVVSGSAVDIDLDRVDVVQPALFAVMTSLARLWESVGVHPDVVIGHSQGEIAAAYVAGGLSLADAVRVVVGRSRAIAASPTSGAMVSVAAAAAETRELIGPWDAVLSIAALNGPAATVVSGDARACVELLAHCERAGVWARRIPVDYASHSDQVSSLRESVLDAISGIVPRTVPSGGPVFVSTVTGRPMDTAELTAEYWFTNLRQTVRFEEAVAAAFESGCRAFIESSPHPVLTGSVQDTLDARVDSTAVVVESLRRDDGGLRRFLASAAELFVAGGAVDWSTVVGAGGGGRVSLPPYAFQRRRFWSLPQSTGDATGLGVRAVGHPLLGAWVETPDSGRVVVTGRVSPATMPWLADHAVAGLTVFPGTGFVELVASVADRLGAAEIRDLAITAPLLLGGNAVQVRIVVDEPDAERGRAVRVYSRPDTGDIDDGPEDRAGSWTAHAEGTVTPVAIAAELEYDGQPWPPVGAVAVDTAGVYEELAGRGYEYGPAFQGLTGVWRAADEVCAEVELRGDAATGFGVHPALLDAVLHAALTVSGWDDRLRLPFAWSGVRVHAVAATRLRARIRVIGDETVSIRAMDVEGAPVLTVESLFLRSLSKESLRGAAVRESSDGLHQMRWRELEDGPDADNDPGELTVFRCLPAESAADVVADAHDRTAHTLDFVQSWLAGEPAGAARAVILTRGAVDTGDSAVTDMAGAAVWGLVASAQSENPGRIVLLDSDSDLDEGAVAQLLRRVPDRESQVVVRAGRPLLPRLAKAEFDPAETTFTATDLAAGTVLVVGGTGGLGALVAGRLVEAHGVRDLVLTSRRGAAAPDGAAVLDELRAAGAHVRVVACDITDGAAVRELISEITTAGRLTGVVHAAGVIDDGVLESLTPDRLRTVMAPKVDGGWNLHRATEDLELPLFAVFSSIVGTLGMPGQANYAAGNRFLDGLISYRRARGLSGVSLAWGLWDRATGMTGHLDAAAVAGMRRAGVGALSTRQGLALWDAGLASGHALLVAARMDRPALRSAAEEGRLSPMLSGLVRAFRRTAAGTAEQLGGLWNRLAGASAEACYDAVLDVVRTQAAAVLGHETGTAIDPGRAFNELGFDSLAALQFRNALAAATGLRLRSSLIFDYPTADALTRYLLAESGSEPSAPASRVVSSTAVGAEPLVIVGMACRYPGGVDSPADLWSMVDEGLDVVGDFPLDRGWDVAGLYDPRPGRVGKCYTRSGGFLSAAGDFDPAFFGISPKEALAMDPQQRLLLEASWEALEDAGIDPVGLKGSATGVYAGLMYHDYPDSDGFGAVASGRVSYALGLEGPAVTVDTACSSSLVALHLAGQAVRSGECELALVGGVTVMATPHMFVEFSRQQGLSPDGRCRSFDGGANGTGWAEGVGVLVVERLSRAEELGHRVLAVVAGSAVNQDGASNGLTAPNGPSQQRVIRQALANAGLDVGDVDLVEAHGTGTKLGDPIEAQALLETYGRREGGEPLWLGSIKSNMGHAQAAAGVAGVIKMVQALRFGRMPATLHVDEPSPHVDWSAGRVELLTEARDWPRNGRPRRAAVSSFGISGTNAHVILEETPDSESGAVHNEPAISTPGLLPWVISAKSSGSLRGQADRLRRLSASGALSAADVAVSLARRPMFEHRAVVFGCDTAELVSGLEMMRSQDVAAGVVTGRVLPGRTALVFSGQGSQRLGMGKELAEAFPVFAAALDEVLVELDRWLDRPLREVMWGEDEALLRATGFAQPALFAVEVAVFRLLRAWGVGVDAVMGHSVGEIAAAHVAGALSLADAARLVAVRGRLMQALPEGGAMVAIGAGEADVLDLLSPGVSVAAVNGPGALVISGELGAVDAVVQACVERGFKTTRLRVSHAFHSALMDPMLADFAAEIGQLSVSVPAIPVVSNLTGRPAGGGYAEQGYWVEHVRRPVLFADGIAALAAEGVSRFLEVGPGAALTAMVGASVDPETAVAIAGLRGSVSEPVALLSAVARLFGAGGVVDWRAVTADSGGQRIPLPPYAFDRQRFWREQPSRTSAAELDLPAVDHPLLRALVESPDSRRLVVTGGLSRAALPWLADHAIFDRVLLPGTGFVDLVTAVAERVGCATVRELTITAPLPLSEAPVALRIVVGEPDTDGERTVTIYARPEPETSSDTVDIDAGAWTSHAEGVVTPLVSAPRPTPELQSWPPAAGAMDLDGTYEDLTRRGYRYGPVFQGLSRVWRTEADTFVEATLPEGGHPAGFGIHPALLDAVLQALLLTSGNADEVELPFAWSGVRVHAPGATRVRARLRTLAPGRVSLEVADSTGRPVLTVESLSLRPISAQRLAEALAVTTTDGLHHLRWISVGTEVDPDRIAETRVVDLADDAGLARWTNATEPHRVVVALRCAFDDGTDSATKRFDMAERAHAVAERALAVLREWLADDRRSTTRLVVLTQGAVDTGGHAVADPAGAAVWGLVASAQSEYPGRITVLDSDVPIDGDAIGRVLARVPAAESQIAVRGDEILVPRLEQVAAAAAVPGSGPWRLDVTETGTLESVRLLPSVPEGPAEGRVRIATRAVGLNFRDVLIALGMYPGADAMLGSEAAGVVTHVGPGVTGFVPGDRVMGVFEDGVGSDSTTDQRMLVRIPAGLSFAQAAAIPVAFATAYLGLFDLADLGANDAVLVHAATGGVGHAAVQLAKSRGAEVFATASPAKWGVLRSMGIDETHIGNSRTLDFESKFRAATGGRGVDVVLDALAGEFVDASMRLMPRGGRFLEMGKTDPRDPRVIAATYPGVDYRPFDLLRAGPDVIQRILTELVELFDRGLLEPPPVMQWRVESASEALRYLSQARHIGKIVLTVPPPVSAGTVLISGGTGGLGALLAQHLVDAHGVRDLVLTSRSGPGAPDVDALTQRLRSAGARVRVESCDVTDRAAVGELVSRILANGRLTGVVHAAGVLDDGLIGSLNADRLRRVLAPKVDGAWNLHEATAGLDLSLFAVFSSIAGVLGTTGQANYAAGNRFLDGLISYRRSRGLPGVSLAWGLWDNETGMTGTLSDGDVARMHRTGLVAMSVTEGLTLWDAALACGRALLVPARLDRAALRALSEQQRLPILLAGLVGPSRPKATSTVDPTVEHGLLERLAGLSDERRYKLVLDLVCDHAAAVLGHADSSAIEARKPFEELGFDSLGAVEFRNRMNAATGLTLPTTLVFDYPNADVLARFVRDLTSESGAPQPDRHTVDEAEVRRVLLTIPLSTLRETGLLSSLMELAGTPAADVADGDAADDEDLEDIDGMDAESLIRRALNTELFDEHDSALEENK